MTFTVKAQVWHGQKTHEVTTNIAGCQDDAEARTKFRRHYNVIRILWAKPVEEKKK